MGSPQPIIGVEFCPKAFVTIGSINFKDLILKMVSMISILHAYILLKWRLMTRMLGLPLTDLDNLPDPDILANEIIENLEAALTSFRNVAKALE